MRNKKEAFIKKKYPNDDYIDVVLLKLASKLKTRMLRWYIETTPQEMMILKSDPEMKNFDYYFSWAEQTFKQSLFKDLNYVK